jgi:hypothetical protein
MNDIWVNGRLVWMCMVRFIWCVIKAMVYACNGCVSLPPLQ